MRLASYSILAACLGAAMFPDSLFAKQPQNEQVQPQAKVVQPDKVVRLIWFPRFSPDGRRLLTAHGSWDAKEAGEVRVWNVQTGKAEHVLAHPRGVRTVAWSPSGAFFISGAYGGSLRYFDGDTAKMDQSVYLRHGVEGARFLNDEKQLVTTHTNGDIRVFELPSRKEVHRLEGAHRGGIWGMAVSPNATRLATAGKDKFVRLWDLDARQILHEIKHPGETNGVAFSRDNKRLLSGCTDSLIRVYDVETGKQTAALEGHEGGGVTDLQFSDDGRLLASAGFDGTVRVWDVANLDKPLLMKTLRGHDQFVFGVAISPQGDTLASAGWDDKLILWDLKDGTQRWSWKR